MMMMIMTIMIITNGPCMQSWDAWLTNCSKYRKKKGKKEANNQSKNNNKKIKQKTI